MTVMEVMTVIRDWFIQILNTELSYDIDIIYGEQNAPAPETPYIVIHQPFALTRIGNGNFEMSETVGEEDTMLYSLNWQGTLSIEEIGGRGDYIKTVLNTMMKQSTKEYFREEKVSILRVEELRPNNELSENIWELRSIVDLIILFPDEGSYEQQYIEVAEMEGSYSGTKN